MNVRIDRQLTALATIAIGGVYMATAARAVLGGDNGEFASIFAQGGVAHPSGYPLYTIYLRAMGWVPGVAPAHAAALATCLLGVAAFLVLRMAARRWGASRPSATLASVVIALSPLAWTMATHAEVFSLHALIAAGILAVSGPYTGLRPTRRAFVIGLLAGLGLCNNHSIVTVAPLGLYAAWTALGGTRSRIGVAAMGAAGLAVGLVPYLWIWAAARAPGDGMMWGETGTWEGLLHHFLRADYGTVQLAISDANVSPWAHAGRLVLHLFSETMVLPTLVAVVGVVALFLPPTQPPHRPPPSSVSSEAIPLPLHRRAVRATRPAQVVSPSVAVRLAVPKGAAVAYVLSLLLAGPVFVAQFNLPLEGLALSIVERFYLLPLAMLVVPIAVGLDRLVGQKVASVDIYGPALVAVLCLAVFVGYEPVRDHHRPDVQNYLVDSVTTADQQAVIIGTGDHRLYGFWYVTHVLGLRPDVVYVDAAMLSYPWYRHRVEQELGTAVEGVYGSTVDTRVITYSLLRAGRAVYLANRFSDAIVRSFPTYPIGTLIRVAPPGSPVPSPEQLERMNVEQAVKYHYAESDPRDPDGWAAYVQSAYTRPWQVLAETYDSMGRPEDAERCRSRVIIVPHQAQ